MKRLVIALLLAACQKSKGAYAPEPVPVTVAKVQQKTVQLTVHAIGNVEPINSVTVRPQVGGVLLAVHFAEGQEVHDGDLLFEIDRRPVEAALAQALAELARDKANAADAEATVRRYANLVKREYVTQQQYDQAVAQAAALRASVAAAEAAVKQARLNLAYAEIRAPLTGRTGSLLVHPGNVLKAPDDKMVVIDQLQPIYVSFAVPEQLLPQVRAQRGAKLRVEATPPASAPAGVEQKASGTISPESHTGELTFVDNTRGQNGEYVFVVKQDHTVESRPVTVSRSDAREAVIEKGLQPGETVVTDGQLRLQQGTKVQIKGEAGS